MKGDIKNLDDIKLLVNSFYEKVQKDEVIGYLFNDVAKVNWEKHLPVMYSFWQQVIFSEGDFKGNPMLVHKELNQKSALSEQHFQRWVDLFKETIDEHFSGPVAESTRLRATSIAMVMKTKIVDGGLF
jgi:hemoglobin